jgi:hypothetical protein
VGSSTTRIVAPMSLTGSTRGPCQPFGSMPLRDTLDPAGRMLMQILETYAEFGCA